MTSAIDGAGRLVEVELDGDARQWQRVAERDQFTGSFRRLDGGYPRNAQHVALLGIARPNQRQRFGTHPDSPRRPGQPFGFRLGSDVNHVRLTGGIEVSEYVL